MKGKHPGKLYELMKDYVRNKEGLIFDYMFAHELKKMAIYLAIHGAKIR